MKQYNSDRRGINQNKQGMYFVQFTKQRYNLDAGNSKDQVVPSANNTSMYRLYSCLASPNDRYTS